MYKLKERKGFTLAELLIVVAIIAVLVAVAIPVFTTQLEKSKEATDVANVRSAYAEVVTQYLSNGTTSAINVKAQQGISGWQTNPQPKLIYQANGKQSSLGFNAKTKGSSYAVKITVNSSTGVLTPSIN